MSKSQTGNPLDNSPTTGGSVPPIPTEPTSPISYSSESSTWDVNTPESHIFQGTRDWKYSSLQALLGWHISVEGLQHRRYDQVDLYVNPKLKRTIVRHDCMSKVADWCFIPGKKYDIKWTIFNHTFALPNMEFVEKPTLDVDGIFGYDFVEEFSPFFFKAWPRGYIQPSRFCIANPLFHPVGLDKALRIYTAAQIGVSAIGVGVFFGPEAGLNTWVPEFCEGSKDSKVWRISELAEFKVICATIKTILNFWTDGKYARVEFHTGSQKLISLTRAMGVSSEIVELVSYHFDHVMLFLDLKKEFAMRAQVNESDCIRILPYANKLSMKQAQRLAELGAKSSLALEGPLKNKERFYIKFLVDRGVAQVPKRSVKDTFKAILVDYLKEQNDTDCKVGKLPVSGRSFGWLEEHGSMKQAMQGNCKAQQRNPLPLIYGENGGETIDETLIPAEEVKKGEAISVWAEEVETGSCSTIETVLENANRYATKKRGNFSTPSSPRLKKRETENTRRSQSVPDNGRGFQDVTQINIPHLDVICGEGFVAGDANPLVSDAYMEAQRIKRSATLEANDIRENAYRHARIIREFATSGTESMKKKAKNFMLEAMEEKERILYEAQKKADLTIEEATQEANNIRIKANVQTNMQAQSVMSRVMQEQKNMMARAQQKEERIINEARIEAEKLALAKVSYAYGHADLTLTTAEIAMRQADDAKRRIEAEERKLIALKEKTLFEENQAISKKEAEEGIAATNAKVEAERIIKDAHDRARMIKKLNSDAEAEAERIIERARNIEKNAEKAETDIREKEKMVEKIRVEAEAEAEKVVEHAKKFKKDIEAKAKGEAIKLLRKARIDADAERERIKTDIEVAMRLEREGKQKEILKRAESLAQHDAKQIIAQAKKRAEELEKQMEVSKKETEEYCNNKRRKAEELVSSQTKKASDASYRAIKLIGLARTKASEIKKMAEEGVDKIPINGDVLGSALPITPELFVKMFLEKDGNEPPLSAEGFAKKLESSKKNVTLGQLVNHNPEGAKLFLEECRRRGRLVHEIEFTVDEKRDGRLKYKKGTRVIPLGFKDEDTVKGG